MSQDISPPRSQVVVVDKPQARPYPSFGYSLRKGKPAEKGGSVGRGGVGSNPRNGNWDEGEGQVGSGPGHSRAQDQGLQTPPPMERLRPAGLGPMAAQPP